jgi:hypothetical protein
VAHSVILRRETDVVLELVDLTDQLTGAPITTAAVTARLTDEAGADLGGATWPITLAHVGATPGTYRGLIPYGVVLGTGRVFADVTADAGAGLHSRWRVKAVVVTE